MEKIETEVVLVPGSALMAPVYKPIDCDAPPWSGRIVYDLKLDDIESVYTFCMEDAWDLGYEDGVCEKEERANPFHGNFMHGIPYSVFQTYYMRGRNASQRTCSQMIQLFALSGALEAR